MSRRTFFVEDVGGSLKRFLRDTPIVARKELSVAVKKATIWTSDEMYDLAPPRSDAPPHIKDDIDWRVRGLRGEAGIFVATPSAEGATASQVDVALYNEFAPNKQPFMMPAAEKAAPVLVKFVSVAMKNMERSLSSGTGI